MASGLWPSMAGNGYLQHGSCMVTMCAKMLMVIVSQKYVPERFHTTKLIKMNMRLMLIIFPGALHSTKNTKWRKLALMYHGSHIFMDLLIIIAQLVLVMVKGKENHQSRNLMKGEENKKNHISRDGFVLHYEDWCVSFGFCCGTFIISLVKAYLVQISMG